MGLSLFNRQTKKRDSVLVVDLGSRYTKTVRLQSKGEGFDLTYFGVEEPPQMKSNQVAEMGPSLLKNAVQSAGAGRSKRVTLVLGVEDSILRMAELPALPVSDMRAMLRLNSKNYLQQEFAGYSFDCQIVPSSLTTASPEDGGSRSNKVRVWVGGAKTKVLEEWQAAAKSVGLQLDVVVPNLVGMSNGFELMHPNSDETVAVVDLGFKYSTISILMKGELKLCRMVALGGDKLTNGLSEAMSINYDEAEGIKIGMIEEVESIMKPLLSPLGRELRASIDFFEHQNDAAVDRVFFGGGGGCSRAIVEHLQSDLILPCEIWNPLKGLGIQVAPEKLAELDAVAPQLAVSIGAGLGVF